MERQDTMVHFAAYINKQHWQIANSTPFMTAPHVRHLYEAAEVKQQ